MKKRNKKNKEAIWIMMIFIITFFLSAGFGAMSNTIVSIVDTPYAIITTIIIILVGVFFDVIGVAIVSDAEHSHHARAAKKHKGAKESLFMIKNAAKVSNIANDVIGDICGVISGALAAVIAIDISISINANLILVSLIVSAVVASLTVGGKAIGKSYAIKNSKKIVEKVGKVISLFTKAK